MAAVYLHERNFQFECPPAGESPPPERSARLYLKEDDVGMELLALNAALFSCFVLHPPDYGTLKVENVLLDRL